MVWVVDEFIVGAICLVMWSSTLHACTFEFIRRQVTSCSLLEPGLKAALALVPVVVSMGRLDLKPTQERAYTWPVPPISTTSLAQKSES